MWPELSAQGQRDAGRGGPETGVGPERAAVRDRHASFYPESDGEPRPDFKQESNLITFACQKEQAGESLQTLEEGESKD